MNKAVLEKLRVNVFIKQCESILKVKGWDLRKEYPELNEAINAVDYSRVLHCFQIALFKHENLGELTTKERVRLVNKCIVPDWKLLKK